MIVSNTPLYLRCHHYWNVGVQNNLPMFEYEKPEKIFTIWQYNQQKTSIGWLFKGTVSSQSNRAQNHSASSRLSQWLKIISHMMRLYYRCRCINEPVIFSHCVQLKLGHRFHALLNVCSDRDDIAPLMYDLVTQKSKDIFRKSFANSPYGSDKNGLPKCQTPSTHLAHSIQDFILILHMLNCPQCPNHLVNMIRPPFSTLFNLLSFITP